MSLFRPPIVRSAGAALDRSLFTKKFPLAAARVLDNKNISKYRGQLEKAKDILKLERLGSVRSDPDESLASKGGRCLLLKPEVQRGGTYIWRCRATCSVLSLHSSNNLESYFARSSEGRGIGDYRLWASVGLRLLDLLYVFQTLAFIQSTHRA